MYLPNFTYTTKTIKNMAEIDLIRGTILNAKITPELDLQLKENALLRSAIASTSPDNVLKVEVKTNFKKNEEDKKLCSSLNEPFKLKSPGSKTGNGPYFHGYLQVLEDLDSYHENGKITEKLLYKMHEKITANILDDVHHETKYREVDVELKDFGKDALRYIPPSHEHVPILMEELLKWANNNSTEISPITVAGSVQWKMLKIHPFIHGNGQTARALTNLILHLRLFDPRKYFSLEEYYKTDEKAYLNALSLDLDEEKSLTRWMEYFTDGILISLSKTRDEISDLLKTGKCFNRSTSKDYTKIISFLHVYGKITPEDVAALLGVNKNRADNYLHELEELSVVERKKRHGSTYYILKIRADQLKKQWKILFKRD